MKNKFSIAMSLAVILAMLLTTLVLADNVVNDVTIGGTDTFTAPGSTTIGYKINTAAAGDPQAGCNASDGTPATVTLSVPAGVTASTTSLIFTACNVFQNVTFSSNTSGDYAITIASVSDSGTGSYKNEANFTLHVVAPPVTNTAPTLNLPADMTVEGNTTGGANVSFSVSATDAEDDPDPTPTCSATSGDFFPLGTTTVDCSVTDSGGLPDSGSFNVTVVDTTAPSISCPANITGTVGQVVNLGSPVVSDIVDASPSVNNNAPGSFGPGSTTVVWTATDDSSNSSNCSQTVTLTYVWLGFFQPVDNLPTVNKAKAGQAIPFKWALQDANGNFVSDLSTVVSYGYGSLICGAGTTDAIESYDTTGTSGLRYDALANQFIFTSQTQKGWAGSCKTFTLYLNDGTKHQANFNFVK
jgi:hypothetical protein